MHSNVLNEIEYKAYDITQLSSSMGAEIKGISLLHLSEAEAEDIHQALLNHKILVFRNQKITPDDLLRFSSWFGDIADYPFDQGLSSSPGVIEIRKEPAQRENFSGKWHTDSTYLPYPPDITILSARIGPKLGGDTVFSNTECAFDELSDPLKSFLRSVNGVNVSDLYKEDRSRHLGNFDSDHQSMRFESVHPAVKIHPDTGKEVLYVNQEHTSHFEGMTIEESRQILSFLFSHIAKSEFTYRIKWEPDTVVIWDNRAVQHHAVNDYHGYLRVMHRVTVNRQKKQTLLTA